MTAYRPSESVVQKTGRRSLVFDKRKSHSGVPVEVPCGQCIGCRLENSRQWALRCMHEKRLHAHSAFLTLTYDDDHLCYSLDRQQTLVLEHLQGFMKRLRERRERGLRFFACGEYGETTNRPHYHVLLLNTRFEDNRRIGGSREYVLSTSDELRGLWPHGHNVIGAVTFESAAYVARYCLKKVSGDRAAAHYGLRKPEFVVMSRRPGLAMEWFKRYRAEAYKHDSAVLNGKEVPLPRFYDDKYALLEENATGRLLTRLERIKRNRRLRAKLHAADGTLRRLRVRERFEELKAERFRRDVKR